MLSARNRLLRVLDRQSIDRLPISTYELCGWNPDAWENHEPSYRGLMDLIRAKTEGITMWNPASDEVASLSAAPARWECERYTSDDGRFEVTESVLHTPQGPRVRSRSARMTFTQSGRSNTSARPRRTSSAGCRCPSYL